MSSSPASNATTRPLDAVAIMLVVMLCLSWGFNQVAVKLAIADIPPLTQAAIRSVGAALLVALWCLARGVPMFARDGSLRAGLLTGCGFAVEFILIYQGLNYTTAARAGVFIYLAPFLVVLAARIFFPADRFNWAQWAGLLMCFAGMLVAFGAPTPAVDPRQIYGDLMMVGAAFFWSFTTLMIKTRLNRIPSEKVMLYQLVVSAPLMGLAAWLLGEKLTHWPSALAVGSLVYQTVWVVSVTYVIWFALVVRYSASRLSVFSFLTPLFGVVAGFVVLGDPLTPAFAAAVAMVAAGLVLVNRTR